MTTQKVQHLVEQQQYRGLGLLKNSCDRLRPRGRCLRCCPERCNTLLPGELSCDVYPRVLAPFARVPGISHKDSDLRLRHAGDTSVSQQILNTRVFVCGRTVLRQVVQRRKRMSLAATKLRNKRENRRSIVCFSREPPQRHACVLAKCPSEAGARKELSRNSVVFRRCPSHDLLEGDGELVRVE